MKKFILLLACCFALIAVNTACSSKQKDEKQTETLTDNTPKEPATAKFIKMAEEMNAEMPMVMPGGLRMDKAEAVSKNEFLYKYTFTKDPVVSSEEFVRSSKPTITMALQGMKEMDDFRKAKMYIIYAYYKMDGSLFAEIKLAPQDYTK